MFTEPPVDGVNESPTIVALKESTFIFTGGGSGVARSATSNAAPLPWLVFPLIDGGPLQDAKEKAPAKNPQTASFLRSMQDPINRIALQRTLTRTSAA
ncbi:MAG: hypothetical protein DMG36_02375 [Acidobacteria bacterium]|nr:MAG: hypothetical protein DMG36_02375 [Acidobacteriota bacterium]